MKPFAKTRGTDKPNRAGRAYAVSIDPGLNTGWAVWLEDEDYSLCACGVGEPPSIFPPPPVAVTIEKPQVYPRMKVPPNDLIALAVTVGRLAARWEASDVSFVTPHEWKGSTPKDIHNARVLASLSASDLEVVKMADRAVPRGQRNNMIDAIGIGLFAYRGKKL